MNKWLYNGKIIKSLKDIPECCMFATYVIDFPDTKEFYFGSKQIFFERRKKLSKKRANELYSGKGGKKKYEIVRTESDWKTYKSSSKVVQDKINSGKKCNFTFLGFYETKTLEDGTDIKI